MASAPSQRFVLTLACANRPGIVAAVAGHLSDAGLNILDAQQYDDTQTDRFFMRVVFDPVSGESDLDALKSGFVPLAERFGMTWTLRDPSREAPGHAAGLEVRPLPRRSALSLAHRRARFRARRRHRQPSGRDLQPCGSGRASRSITFRSPRTRSSSRKREVWELIRDSKADLVVLARYMQVLSDGLAAKLAGRCINIHHSFLPGFKGAKPYHQAHARGVKLIGATAHYVTADLDEGPIIEQDVESITHRDSAEDLVRKGRDIERRVLARAVRYHLEDRILLNGRKTVVFAD